MPLSCLPALRSLLARPQPSAEAPPLARSAERTEFSAKDWGELSEQWHRSRSLGPERVIAWRERREVGRFIHGYPADEPVCRGGRYGLGPALTSHQAQD